MCVKILKLHKVKRETQCSEVQFCFLTYLTTQCASYQPGVETQLQCLNRNRTLLNINTLKAVNDLP